MANLQQQREQVPQPSLHGIEPDPITPAAASLEEEDSAALPLLQLTTRLLNLRACLGPEVAFVALRNNPELLDVPVELIAARRSALAKMLGSGSVPPADEEGGAGVLTVEGGPWQQVVELRGDILLTPSEQLEANLDALVEGLR